MIERPNDPRYSAASFDTMERSAYMQHLDRKLDEALEGTFPASDPVAVTPSRRRGQRSSAVQQQERGPSP